MEVKVVPVPAIKEYGEVVVCLCTRCI